VQNKGNQKQLTESEADYSRSVTKIRWVIESRNGHVKNFKALTEVANQSLSHIMDDYRIVAALINCFFPKLYTDDDNEEIAMRMNTKMTSKTLSLDKYLVNFKKIVFEPIDACNLKDFPRLELEVIRKELTFGNNQLKNALSYLAEHFNKNDNIELLVSKECISDRNKHILQELELQLALEF
jgi:hypothetical protein